MLRGIVIESRPGGDDEEVVHDVIGLIQSGLKKREEGEERRATDRKRDRGHRLQHVSYFSVITVVEGGRTGFNSSKTGRLKDSDGGDLVREKKRNRLILSSMTSAQAQHRSPYRKTEK